MPRLRPRILHHASHIDPLLPWLLRECRDLESARNELRWLREHACAKTTTTNVDDGNPIHSSGRDQMRRRMRLLNQYVAQRGRAVPLQYILGSQPFGDLDVRCRPGVLIPRAETEAYTERVAEVVGDMLLGVEGKGEESRTHYPQKLKVLDVCTGSGCIALLLQWRLSQMLAQTRTVHTLGVDRSAGAVQLAESNRKHNVRCLTLEQTETDNGTGVSCLENVEFCIADLVPASKAADASSNIPSVKNYLQQHLDGKEPYWDVLVSNPPYVSNKAYNDGTTTRSVRRYEPREALIPQLETADGIQTAPGDEFYPHILELADHVKARVVVLEVGDTMQADRVVDLIRAKTCNVASTRKVGDCFVEAWKDWETEDQKLADDKASVRVVVWWRGSWADSRQRMLKNTMI